MPDGQTPNGGNDETMTSDEARARLRRGATMSDADVRAYRSVAMLQNENALLRARLATAEQRAEHADDIARSACEVWTPEDDVALESAE